MEITLYQVIKDAERELEQVKKERDMYKALAKGIFRGKANVMPKIKA